MKKESIGQRGVTAQKTAEAHLKYLNTRVASFTFERMPDARAAMGRAKKAVSDYLCWWKPVGTPALNVPLEVKSTEHDYRLPGNNLTQLPKLKLLAKCGANPYVVVWFKGINKWRIAPISFFETGLPSWDMRELPVYPDFKAAIESTGVFPVV